MNHGIYTLCIALTHIAMSHSRPHHNSRGLAPLPKFEWLRLLHNEDGCLELQEAERANVWRTVNVLCESDVQTATEEGTPGTTAITTPKEATTAATTADAAPKETTIAATTAAATTTTTRGQRPSGPVYMSVKTRLPR